MTPVVHYIYKIIKFRKFNRQIALYGTFTLQAYVIYPRVRICVRSANLVFTFAWTRK